MECGEKTATFLFQTEKIGYLLYSFPTRETDEGRVAVNSAFSFERVLEMLYFIDDEQLYQLQAADGSTLMIGKDLAGKTYILSTQESEQVWQNGKYTIMEEQIKSTGMTISLLYDKNKFFWGKGLYQMQLINMLMIVTGILLSAAISWKLSKRRMNDITHLEKIAKGDAEEFFPEMNMYSKLQKTIINVRGDIEENQKQILESEAKLRVKIFYMIFYGMFRSTDDYHGAFREIGLEGCPEHYFVGAIYATEQVTEDLLPQKIKDYPHIYVIYEAMEILIFLYEISDEDYNQMQRRQIARDFRSYFRQQNCRDISIGMSQVFTDPLLIEAAYNQSISVLEDVVSGKKRDFCGCWEENKQNTSFVLPDAAALQNFSQSLADRDYKECKKWFLELINDGSTKTCSRENVIYIRSIILQQLVAYLQKEDMADKCGLLSKCINIDMTDDKVFRQTVENVLKQSLTRETSDSFSKMLMYIEKNYHRSDLTYEEVAAAGAVGKTYVSKIFRIKTGMSYIEYLTAVRMDRAHSMLCSAEYSVSDVAKLVGYENEASFRRVFKEKYGVSVGEYCKNAASGTGKK